MEKYKRILETFIAIQYRSLKQVSSQEFFLLLVSLSFCGLLLGIVDDLVHFSSGAGIVSKPSWGPGGFWERVWQAGWASLGHMLDNLVQIQLRFIGLVSPSKPPNLPGLCLHIQLSGLCQVLHTSCENSL